MDLESITALIGENSCGKTSVLDALALCFGPGTLAGPVPFRPGDFHVRAEPGAEPVSRIRLVFRFREDRPGSWGGTLLADVLPAPEPGGRREAAAEVVVQRDPSGSATAAQWRLLDVAGRPVPDGGEAVVALRRLHPVIRLRLDQPAHPPGPADEGTIRPGNVPGERSDASAGAPPDTGSPGPDGEVTQRLRRTVASAYHRFSGSWRPRLPELREALEAARALAARGAAGLLPFPAIPARRDLSQLAETPLAPAGSDALRPGAPEEGAGIQNLALLMLLGAVLDAVGRSPLAVGSWPVVLIEEAEAHLHPILAASVWRVLERIPGQKVVTTNSGDLLASIPLHAIRRLVRRAEGVHVHAVAPHALTLDEKRRVGYHVRLNRASSFFARCWLLVEGESESWLLPELARLLGHDFPAEGIRCVEFAQCGLTPLVRTAQGLGLEWHVLTDGDRAGQDYAATVRALLPGEEPRSRLTVLPERDIEHHLWASGYAAVYREVAAPPPGDEPGRRRGPGTPTATIDRALKARGKPWMALAVVEACQRAGSPGVPPALGTVVRTAVRLARSEGPPGP